MYINVLHAYVYKNFAIKYIFLRCKRKLNGNSVLVRISTNVGETTISISRSDSFIFCCMSCDYLVLVGLNQLMHIYMLLTIRNNQLYITTESKKFVPI